jgi:hypothetical protein
MHRSVAFHILALLGLSQSVIGAVGTVYCGLAGDDFCSGATDGSGSGKAASTGEGCGKGVSIISGSVGGKPESEFVLSVARFWEPLDKSSDLGFSGCIGLMGTG